MHMSRNERIFFSFKKPVYQDKAFTSLYKNLYKSLYTRTTLSAESSKAPDNVPKRERRAKKRWRRTFKVTECEVGDEEKRRYDEAFGRRCEIRAAVSGGARNRLSVGSIEEGGVSTLLPWRERTGRQATARKRGRGGRSEEGNNGKGGKAERGDKVEKS